MLDPGGKLMVWVERVGKRASRLYIQASLLGIRPGKTYIENEYFMNAYREPSEKLGRDWYIRIYCSRKGCKRSSINHTLQVGEVEYYNEVANIQVREEWEQTEVCAGPVLEVIKKRCKIPSDLIYEDDFWSMKKIYYSIGRSVMDDKKDLKRLSFSLDSYTFYIIPISIKTVLKKTTIVNAIISAVNNGEDLTPFRSKGLNQKAPLDSEMEITEEDWNMLSSLLGQ